MRRQGDTTTTPRSGLVEIVLGILQDVKVLVHQEAQLLRDEVKLEVGKAGRAASSLGIGIGVAAIGGLFLLLMLVHGLHEWFELPLWMSYGLVGAALAGAGAILIVRARSLAGSVNTVPKRTLYAVKEDAQWIKEQVMSKKT